MSGRSPEDWRNELIEFVRSFASLTITAREDGKGEIRLRRGVGDVMHVFGYYFEQNAQRLHSMTTIQRLTIAADAMRYIAEHLED